MLKITNQIERQYYTVGDLAERYPYSKGYIWKLIKDLKIPHLYDRGGKIKLHRKELYKVDVVFSLILQEGYTLWGVKRQIRIKGFRKLYSELF